MFYVFFFFFKQKTAYEMRISDWSSDVCSSDLRPPVLFLDEPTSGVDPITRREFWTHINGLARKGVTVMVTTHFMDEAEYCDRVAMLYRARLIALDTPDALKRSAVSDLRPDPTMEDARSEEHTSELQSLMRLSYAVFCLK